MKTAAFVLAFIISSVWASDLYSKEDTQRESASTLATRIRKLSQIRSVGGSSAADLGLRFVQPKRDKKTGLKDLSLTRTNVSDQGLPALTKLTSLRDLSLSETKVTDEGLKALRQMKSLTELTLLRTQVTDQGLLLLSELPSLQKVHTYGTNVTKEGQREFKRRVAERSAKGH